MEKAKQREKEEDWRDGPVVKEHIALAEDPGSIYSPTCQLTAICPSVPGDPALSPWPLWAPHTRAARAQMQALTHTRKTEINPLKGSRAKRRTAGKQEWKGRRVASPRLHTSLHLLPPQRSESQHS